MVPFYFLGQDDRNEVKQDFVGHVMPTPLHSLGEDDWGEVQHDFSDHMTPLAPHGAHGIVNGTITFLM